MDTPTTGNPGCSFIAGAGPHESEQLGGTEGGRLSATGTANATARHTRTSLRWDCPSAAPAAGGKGVLHQEMKTQFPQFGEHSGS